MNDRISAPTSVSGRSGSLQPLILGLRKILERTDLESEDHRKAALRSQLHRHAAGMTRDEIEDMVQDLRQHFPDRIFESISSARNLAGRTEDLEAAVGRLREERDKLRRRHDHLAALMLRLARAAGTPADQTASSFPGVGMRQSLAQETEDALVEIAELCLGFVVKQEATAGLIEQTLGVDSSGDPSQSLAKLMPTLARTTTRDQEVLDAIHKRLRQLQMLPGALMMGARQSWKSGTRQILEHLDPAQDKGGFLKLGSQHKEVEKKFEQFWDQFDRNVEHYYRNSFERVYRDKMEEET